MKFAFSVMLLAAVSGCASSDAFVLKAIRNSKAYESVLARSSHIAFVIEEKHPSYAIIALGEAPEAELKRFYTLRVSWTGRVQRRYVDMHGEGVSWLPDR
ncbi:MAG: hypothetical protein NTV51_12845 [Verrucomicrobia bacterium]|nr:hypothetical protein [Verrucomicrobiota bacterium]